MLELVLKPIVLTDRTHYPNRCYRLGNTNLFKKGVDGIPGWLSGKLNPFFKDFIYLFM